ncbi:MAG: hypothetical protein H7301_08480 [Cryobacterium sp.]|nr:hypothetical protein [Oligoflexia bacterium]
MSKQPFLTKMLALALALAPLSVYADDGQGPGGRQGRQAPSAEEMQRRSEQSARDKAKYRESQGQNQSQNQSGYSSRGNVDEVEMARRRKQSEDQLARNAAAREGANSQSQARSQSRSQSQSQYPTQTQQQPNYKYGSAEERQAAKEERKRIRDMGGTTVTTETVKKKDGTKVKVVNSSDSYGTTTQVDQVSRNGTVSQRKTVEQEKTGYRQQEISKRTTDFNRSGYVTKVTRERSEAFQGSSRYNTILSKSTTYSDYGTRYGSYYKTKQYADLGYRSGFDYRVNTVVNIYNYFNNPVIFWLYNDVYDSTYSSTYWGSEYSPYGVFRQSGIFLPTQELVNLSEEIANMRFANFSEFRTSMSSLATQLTSRIPGVQYNDIVITQSEVYYGKELVLIDGFVNTSLGAPVAFRALLDLNNAMKTLVFAPTQYDSAGSSVYNLVVLQQINARIGYSAPAPTQVYIPVATPSSDW